LDAVIMQRIKDELFDDPMRMSAREIEEEKKRQQNAGKDAETLNYEKSKKGLSELYEDKYKVDVLHYSRNPEEEKAKDEITLLMKELFHKFEQLTNFNFTPSYIDDEVKVCPKYRLTSLDYDQGSSLHSRGNHPYDKGHSCIRRCSRAISRCNQF